MRKPLDHIAVLACIYSKSRHASPQNSSQIYAYALHANLLSFVHNNPGEQKAL